MFTWHKFCTVCPAGIVDSGLDLCGKCVRTSLRGNALFRDFTKMVIKNTGGGAPGRNNSWSQKVWKHPNNARRKGYWTILARWDDDAAYRKLHRVFRIRSVNSHSGVQARGHLTHGPDGMGHTHMYALPIDRAQPKTSHDHGEVNKNMLPAALAVQLGGFRLMGLRCVEVVERNVRAEPSGLSLVVLNLD